MCYTFSQYRSGPAAAAQGLDPEWKQARKAICFNEPGYLRERLNFSESQAENIYEALLTALF